MKGFTLVELLAVIIILGIVISIATPIVINVIDSSSEKLYEEQVQLIENTTEKWVIEHTGEVEREESFSRCVSIEELQNGGYISAADVKNPKTGEKMSGGVRITYDVDHKQFKYEYEETACPKV